MNTNPQNLIAVMDRADVAGAMMFWKLEGTVDLSKLRAVWIAKGLDEKWLPGEPSAKAALRLAMRSVSKTRRLSRPLADRKGYAIVTETAQGRDLDHTIDLRAGLKTSDVEGSVPRLVIEPETHPLATTIRAAYDAMETAIPSEVIGSWLSMKITTLLGAVALRDSGGVYFVPQDKVNTLTHIGQALSAVTGHRVFQIPAMKSEDAVEAILSAITAEAENAASKLETATDDQTLGKRALRGKVAACDKLREKIEAYETLLGRAMPEIQERVETLRSALTIAATLASEADDKAA